MKILFAVSNENISDTIVKKYQKEYKEILSYKNVYYFNAILKEIQKDKSYDRIIISEDLEAFSNNNYEAIDKFIFEKLDDISDEAQDIDGNETSIILICADRHTKGSAFLVKLFGIGIYNALLGNDRVIANVCKLINKPRTKKDAKMYYKIDADDVNYSKSDSEVSEAEINNIINFFKKTKSDEYADAFNRLAEQYTDDQLKIVVNCLPIGVKAVLEEECLRYQQLMSVNGIMPRINSEQVKSKNARKQTGIKIDMIENKTNSNKISGTIVIPSSVKNSASAKKKAEPVKKVDTNIPEVKIPKTESKVTRKVNKSNIEPEPEIELISEIPSVVPKAKKVEVEKEQKVPKVSEVIQEEYKIVKKKKRMPDGSFKIVKVKVPVSKLKNKSAESTEKSNVSNTSNKIEKNVKEKKAQVEKKKKVEDEDVFLPGLDDDLDDTLPGLDEFDVDTEDVKKVNSKNVVEEDDDDDNFLPDLSFDEDEDDDISLNSTEDTSENNDFTEEDDDLTEEVDLPGLDDLDDILPSNDDDTEEDDLLSGLEEDDEPLVEETQTKPTTTELPSIKPRIDYSMSSLNSLLTKDKKIVAFIGTTKNGTSFLVNNLAAMFSAARIDTAILDMKKNKNSYYIYTDNKEELRNTAFNSISKLQKGFAEGIKVGRNLTVYTSLPNDGKDYSDAESILSTLVQNHSLVLIDCDFDTDPAYFASCQEIYLVQSMDILTIQPLTAFLRDLKTQGVLESEKVRVVINKEIKVNDLTTKAIVAGMSFYNDPSMSFMTELFNKDTVTICTIPFEDSVYSKYLHAMVECNISVNEYSKTFKSKLENLGNMVYPSVGKSAHASNISAQPTYEAKGFSGNMGKTLSKMKKSKR